MQNEERIRQQPFWTGKALQLSLSFSFESWFQFDTKKMEGRKKWSREKKGFYPDEQLEEKWVGGLGKSRTKERAMFVDVF